MTRRSIRRLLLTGAATFGLVVVASFAGLLGLAVSMRRELARQTRDLVEEQRIADRIVSSVYAQLLAAYRNVQDPGHGHRTDYLEQGGRVYAELRKYLSHEMSVDARIGVETIKELHQDLEIAGQRALDVDALAAPAERRALLDALAQRATRLEAAVDRFVALRQRDYETLHARQAALLRRLVLAASLAAVLLLAGILAFVRIVRTRLLRPLDQLASAAERVGRGELEVRIPTQPDQEFAALTHSFNEMINHVQQAHVAVSAQNRELADALAQLHTTQEELVQHEKLSALGGMLAGLAHELNNPLAGMLGLTEVLHAELRGSDDAEARRMAEELVTPMRVEALRARDLVRNLLQFSRRSSAESEVLPVAELVDVVVGLRAYAFRQAGKALDVRIPPDLRVLGDRQQLEHAFLNVVNNALDALVADGGSALEIHAAPAGDQVELTFRDDGAGFREPGRALDPFYTTKPVGEGTGLGLTLVHKFVDASGGTVSVGNAERRGAVVRIVLPCAPAGRAAVEAAPRAMPAQPEPALPAGLRVLVVDDEPSVREAQRRLLTRAGIEVLLAPDGSAACEVIMQAEVDVVVTDLRMPGAIDGVALYRWIVRERPALADRVLFVTGDVHGIPAEIAELSPRRLLQKPFHRAEYIERVREALGAPSAT